MRLHRRHEELHGVAGGGMIRRVETMVAVALMDTRADLLGRLDYHRGTCRPVHVGSLLVLIPQYPHGKTVCTQTQILPLTVEPPGFLSAKLHRPADARPAPATCRLSQAAYLVGQVASILVQPAIRPMCHQAAGADPSLHRTSARPGHHRRSGPRSRRTSSNSP